MSLDVFLRSRARPTLKKVESILFPMGWEAGQHLLFEPKGSYVWFHQENFESTRGAWIFVRKPTDDDPPGTATVFHGYTNAGRSFEDVEALNAGLRVLRRQFGGSLYDPQRGVNGYLLNDLPKLSAAEKACGFVYLKFQSNLSRVHFLAVELDDQAKQRIELLGEAAFDRGLLTNNLVLPFLVASFEAFLKEFFIAYVDRHPVTQERVFTVRKRLDADVVKDLLAGKLTVGRAEAAQFSFQNIASANAAFSQYLELDLYRLWRRRRRFQNRYYFIIDLIEQLLEARHRIIHGTDLELTLNRTDVDRYVFALKAAAAALVSHLQEERQFRVDLEELL